MSFFVFYEKVCASYDIAMNAGLRGMHEPSYSLNGCACIVVV